MNMPIHIELLARNGKVLERKRFMQTPVRIGRAYDNDLIIDDPYMAPHHALLEEQQGELVLGSVDTRNGIVVNKRSVDQVQVHGDTQVRLGHTRLRVRRADHPVADELRDATNHGWEGLAPAVIGLIIAAAGSLGMEWLTSNSASETIKLVSGALITLLGLLSWAAIWAVINRLFAGSARFGRHLFITGVGLLLSMVAFELPVILAYRLSWPALDRYNDFYMFLPVALAVYFHLVTVNPQLRRRMASFTAIAYLGLVGLLLSSNYNNYGVLADKAYMSAPHLPGLRPAQLTSIDSFLQTAGSSQARLESRRKQAEQ